MAATPLHEGLAIVLVVRGDAGDRAARRRYTRPVRAPPAAARLRFAAGLWLTLGLGAQAGCAKGNAATQVAEATAPTMEQARATRCGIRHSANKPLVIDWPSAERAALESRAKQGLVPVRWQGCEIEVLTSCSARGAYAYIGLNPKQETVRIRSEDELYANLPVGAAQLEGKLERYGSLEVDMTVIGRMETDRFDFHRTELEGRCDQATHVVTGLTVGAFVFSAGAGADLSAGARFKGAGAGASSRAERELLNTDGEAAACAQASQADLDAPAGCGALLRVEFVPIEGTRVAGAGDPSDASTQPSSSGSSDVAAPVDTGLPVDLAQLDRQIRTMQITYVGGYVLGLGAIGAAALGARQLSSSRAAIEASRTDVGERADALRSYRVAQGLTYGGAAGAAVFFAAALWANARATRLKKQREALRVGLTPTPGGGLWVAAEVSF